MLKPSFDRAHTFPPFSQAGGSINDFQSRTYARIQLSKAGEYYPGTAERTLLVTGRLKELVAALSLIFQKLMREGVAPLSPRTRATLEAHGPEALGTSPARLMVKILVPQLLCGIIIGRGGATVRAMAAETDTVIRVTAPEGPAVALNHRVVTVNGTVDGVLRAVALMTLKQTEDSKYATFSELPSSYLASMVGPGAGPPMGPPYAVPYGSSSIPPVQQMHYQYMSSGAGGMYGGAQHAFGPPSADGTTSVSYHVTEEQVAALTEQGVLESLQATTGVRIQLEPQEPVQIAGGGKVRVSRLTMTGHPEGLAYAHYALGQRIMGAMMQQQYPAAMYQQYPAAPGYYQYRSAYGALGGQYGAEAGRRPSPRTLTPRQNEEI